MSDDFITYKFPSNANLLYKLKNFQISSLLEFSKCAPKYARKVKKKKNVVFGMSVLYFALDGRPVVARPVKVFLNEPY